MSLIVPVPDVLTYRTTEIRKFKRCRRSHWLGYRKDGIGYMPNYRDSDDIEGSGRREGGTAVHAGLQAVYSGGDWRQAIHAWADSYLYTVEDGDGEAIARQLPPGIVKQRDLALIMVEGYVDWLRETGADAGERTLWVERRINFPVGVIRGHQVYVSSKIDRMVQDTHTGEYVVEDHKTVQSLDIGAQLAVDDQLLTYVTAARFEGLVVPRMRHNMLRTVKRTARATPPFYGRVEMPVNDEQLDHHWTHLTTVLDRMVEETITLAEHPELHHRYAEPFPTKDCSWDCPFIGVCPMMDDGSDWEGVLGAMYRTNDPDHPEVIR